MIGDDVEITVVDIRGDKVRLGIKAPPHIPVHRKEVYEAIKRENRSASQVSPDDLKSVATSKVPSTDQSVPPVIKQPPENEHTVQPEDPNQGPSTKGRRRVKPADSNTNSENNNIKSNNSGCEGTQPTGLES